jgi:hypothetical protein
MSFDEHNPRLSGRRPKDAANEQFQTVPLGQQAYLSKRNAAGSQQRTLKAGQPSEQDMLTTSHVSDASMVSNVAHWLQSIAGCTQVLYTIILVILVAAQASTDLTIRTLFILLLIHCALTTVTLAMHNKIHDKTAKSIDSEHRGLDLLRHMRSDRRTVLLLVNVVLSCTAMTTVAYIARVAPSWEQLADTSRQTGADSYVHRALDSLALWVYTLAIPTALLVLQELRFGLHVMMRHQTQVQSAEDGSDDEGPQILSPRS